MLLSFLLSGSDDLTLAFSQETSIAGHSRTDYCTLPSGEPQGENLWLRVCYSPCTRCQLVPKNDVTFYDVITSLIIKRPSVGKTFLFTKPKMDPE